MTVKAVHYSKHTNSDSKFFLEKKKKKNSPGWNCSQILHHYPQITIRL